jgi:invasion protein IalB
MTANERLVSAMRSGKAFRLNIQDVNKKSIELSLPLLGFGLAFDKVR